MALPTYVGKSSFDNATGAIAPDFTGAGHASGDLLLLFCESANETIATPSGWSPVATQPGTGTVGGAGGVKLAVFSKVSDGTETTVTIADSGNHNTAIGMVFRHASGTPSINVTDTAVEAVATSTATFPSVITTVNDCLIVLAAASDRDANSTATFSGWSNATIGTITERHDQTVTSAQGGGLGIATGSLATAGATGTTTVNVTAVTYALMTIALGPPAGSGSQNLDPSLLTNTQTFYGPTVTAGQVDLAPSLITNAQTFYAPTVSASYTLTPGLVTNSQSFYGPTVTPGAVTLAPSLFTNSQTFYGPAVAGAAVTLSPPLLTNTQTFYAPTVAAGYTLAPSLVTNAQSFYGPSATASNTLLSPLVANDNEFFAPTVTQGGNVSLLPSLLVNVAEFFPVTVINGIYGPPRSDDLTIYGDPRNDNRTIAGPARSGPITMTGAARSDDVTITGPARDDSIEVAA